MNLLQKAALVAVIWAGAGLGLPAGAQGVDPAMVRPAASQAPEDFARAKELYDNGMYAEAGRIFSRLAEGGDWQARGYSVLCSIALRQSDADAQAGDYLYDAPYSNLIPQIRYRQACNFFDDGDYEAALPLLRAIDGGDLLPGQRDDYRFRRAFSAFGAGDYAAAEQEFRSILEDGRITDYTAPSRYCIGYIHYNAEDFHTARDWFALSAQDPRFAQISNYYLVECAFLDKDYTFVTDKGPALYEDAPEERQPHLARLISEAFLIQGDTEGAEAYYRKTALSKTKMERGDYFFAGSVLYNVGDYKGAVDNFSQMGERADSLGQIASYQMGYAYIKTKDKVSAMQAFKEASELPFDKALAEDACFNYAKLSFDLNHDPQAFETYLERYPDREKTDMIYEYVALAALYNHDYEAAIVAYDNIDELNPQAKSNYVRANYLRARQLIGSGAWRPAAGYLKAVTFYTGREEPVSQLSRYWLAQSLFHDEKYAEAAAEWMNLYTLSALDGQPEGIQIPYDMAYAWFRAGDYDKAAKWFDQYLKDSHALNIGDAAVRRADCDFYSKDYKGAIARYDEILQSDSPVDEQLYIIYQDAVACGLLGRDARKMELLERVLDASPSAPYFDETMFSLGRSYFEKGDTGSAIRVLKRLRSETSDQTVVARTLLELGMVYSRADEQKKALSAFKEVVEGAPGTSFAESALLAIESIYRDRGESDKYLDYLAAIGQTGEMTEDEREDMYFRSAEQVYLTGNWNGAVSAMENFKSRYPKGRHLAHADFYIAECYNALGRKDQARDYYSRAADEGVGTSGYVLDAMRRYSALSYSMEQYKDAWQGWQAVFAAPAQALDIRKEAATGMMRSAFRAHMYEETIAAVEQLRPLLGLEDAALVREMDYSAAKSLLATSRREEAAAIFSRLAKDPTTPEGAESTVFTIQDLYDKGRFEEAQKAVYKLLDFPSVPQYWLARAYIILADTYAEQDNYRQALRTFESIRDGYDPAAQDDILPTVRARIADLDRVMNPEK